MATKQKPTTKNVLLALRSELEKDIKERKHDIDLFQKMIARHQKLGKRSINLLKKVNAVLCS